MADPKRLGMADPKRLGMADPKRLGKRGAYRFGELRAAEPSPRRGPARREPSFRTRRSRGPVLAWLTACAVTAALLGLGAGFGWWFLPFAAGLAAGAGPWRTLPALGLVVLAVAVGWGAALWWPALSGAPAGATARAIAALAGLPPHAAIGVAATVGIGILQAVVALWLARALTYRLR
jgi:hypothetical protein